jgi:cyclase
MVKKRVIPVILLRDGKIVQSRQFTRYNIIGEPTPAVERISRWSSDELIYLDITPSSTGSVIRVGLHEVLRQVALKCTVPLTFGGGIRDIEEVRARLRLGADKVTLNTAAAESPELIRQIAAAFGSQCLVVSIDAAEVGGRYEVVKGGWAPTGRDPVEFAKAAAEAGAGEILLNSVGRDGVGGGYDLELIEKVSGSVPIPVIALGGAGSWDDFANVMLYTSASAVAAANIFHHSENSVHRCKEHLHRLGLPVRRPARLSSVSSHI